MTVTSTEHHREVIEWLVSVGATEVRIEKPKRGHHRVVFTFAGRGWFSPLSSTPGGLHAAQSALKNLRHMLGLVGEKRVGERRTRRMKRRRCAAIGRPVDLALPSADSPFAVLAQLLPGAAA